MASEDVEFKCYVGNLKNDVKRYELEEAFSHFGDVIETYIVYQSEYDYDDPSTYGFVTFKDEKSMRDAIKGMNGLNLNLAGIYTTITVEEAHSSRKSRRRRGRVDSKKNACVSVDVASS